ncbi:MAG TPA: hypothetical protein VF469_40850 [Kofleriaceae bacterium]
MSRDLLLSSMVLLAVAGCSGGAGIGDSCGGNDDCGGGLQCLNGLCAARCLRAPQCGDGYSCDASGLCIASHAQAGDKCKSEVDCEAGLSCRINGAEVDSENRLIASCAAEYSTGPAGAACDVDSNCRNGTCEVGHCVDLCRQDRDCPVDFSCMTIPRVAMNGAQFAGCLPTQATLSWDIPVTSPSAQVALPVPAGALSAELVMSVDDPTQEVGATGVLDPCGCTSYQVPCPFGPTPDGGACTAAVANDQFYSRPGIAAGGGSGSGASNTICTSNPCSDLGNPPANRVRHRPGLGRSVLLMPSIPGDGEIKGGAYLIRVSSFWPDGSPGSAVPHIRAVVRLGAASPLDLHFFFLDLSDHPCVAMTGGATLDAAGAQQPGSAFQGMFLGELASVFLRVNLKLGALTYADIADRHDLDSLDVANVGSLLALGSYPSGVNVFFIRSLSPLGLTAFSPSPGPAGVAGSPESGIVIALDTLCYRDWTAVARLAAHEIARYMGLYHNVEPRDPAQTAGDPPWQDLIEDSDTSSANLMYFSEPTGIELSAGQRDALGRSAVMR